MPNLGNDVAIISKGCQQIADFFMAQNSDIEPILKPLRLRYKNEPQHQKLILKLVDAIKSGTGKQCQYFQDYSKPESQCLNVVDPDRHYCHACSDRYWAGADAKAGKRSIREIQKRIKKMTGRPEWQIDGFENEEDWKLYKQAQEALDP